MAKNFPLYWFALDQPSVYPIRALKITGAPTRKGTVTTLKIKGSMSRGEVFREPLFKRLYRVVGIGRMEEDGTFYNFKRVDGASVVEQDNNLLKAGTTIKVVSRLPLSKIIPTFD